MSTFDPRTAPYPEFVAVLAAVRAALIRNGHPRPDDAGGLGNLDSFRLMAEWTPPDLVGQDLSVPRRMPPMPYPDWIDGWVPKYLAARRKRHLGTGYNDIAMDAWRVFGSEAWPPDVLLLELQGLPHPNPPFVVRRSGLIVRDGQKTIRDGTGALHAMGMTFMWAMQGARSDRDRYHQNLDWLQPFGIDYLRILCEVDWDGLPILPPTSRIGPPWNDYASQLAYVIDANWQRAGCRTELTVLGKGTGCDPATVANIICDVLLDGNRYEKIQDIECGNEYPLDDVESLVTMARIFRQRVPQVALVALTNLGSTDAQWSDLIDAERRAGCTGITLHPDRSMANFGWRAVRQMRDADDNRIRDFVSLINEPVGPHSSVASNTSPLQLAMCRANAHVLGAAAYVLHVGDMVQGVEDPSHGRHPNLWEVAGLPDMIKAVRGVDVFLMDGIEGWTTTNQHGSTERVGPHPLLADGIWTDGNDHGVDRTYAAVRGGDFVQVVNGVKNHVTLTADRAMHVKAVQPASGAVVEADLPAGGTIQLAGGDGDGMPGYVVKGLYRG